MKHTALKRPLLAIDLLVVAGLLVWMIAWIYSSHLDHMRLSDASGDRVAMVAALAASARWDRVGRCALLIVVAPADFVLLALSLWSCVKVRSRAGWMSLALALGVACALGLILAAGAAVGGSGLIGSR